MVGLNCRNQGLRERVSTVKDCYFDDLQLAVLEMYRFQTLTALQQDTELAYTQLKEAEISHSMGSRSAESGVVKYVLDGVEGIAFTKSIDGDTAGN